MLKVLHVIPSVSSARGGPTLVALNLVKALRDRNVDAEIVTTNDDDGIRVLDVPCDRRIEYEGVPIRFFPLFATPTKGVSLGNDRGFLFSWPLTRWMWQNLNDYDILDTHYLFSYCSTCAGAIARWKNIPYTVRTMGQLSPWALAQSRRKKQIYAALIERQNLNKAAIVHCTSRGEAEDVNNFGVVAPKAILPLGVRSGTKIEDAGLKLRQLYNIPAESAIVLFLSRIHYKKRPELLLDALHSLKSKHHFHLIFAGTGDKEYLQQIESLIESLDLTKQVTFAGFVTGESKALVLQGSDFFVLPSFAENFAIAVAEAMAAGLPVIITPEVQIAPEVDAANAGLVVEGEVKTVVDAIATLLTSPQLRQELGNNGKQLVKTRYSWEAIAGDLISVYQKAIDSYR
ncbi:MAG: glycosyltransferase [Cyanobacteria bacterium SBLK]|nr:glycosyltransferase [Cyanobacteria bacterium SBLK]